MAGMSGSVVPGGHSDSALLYVGVWQATMAFTAAAAPTGRWLSVSASVHSPSSGSICLGAAPCVTGVEYLTARGPAAGNMAMQCSHLLEVIQGIAGVGASEVQLRTLGAMPASHAAGPVETFTVSESASQGMLRTVAA